MFYSTGKPCPRGHKSKRRTHNRSCVKCLALDSSPRQFKARLQRRINTPNLVLFQNAKERSRKRDLVFKLTISDIVMSDSCPCCKKPFVLGAPTGRPVPQAPSLDRLVPEKGYVPGNVVVICTRCNTLKRDGTLAEFQLILDWMKTHA